MIFHSVFLAIQMLASWTRALKHNFINVILEVGRPFVELEIYLKLWYSCGRTTPGITSINVNVTSGPRSLSTTKGRSSGVN